MMQLISYDTEHVLIVAELDDVRGYPIEDGQQRMQRKADDYLLDKVRRVMVLRSRSHMC